jgi:hypothetical protein
MQPKTQKGKNRVPPFDELVDELDGCVILFLLATAAAETLNGLIHG